MPDPDPRRLRHNPAALALMRGYNWPASLGLYGLCGVLWLYRGSLRELSRELTGGRPAGRGR